ncbi:MAG TPA: IS66 family insertion sequence element accessory protein TnpB [Kofleriaceae bacterium]|nr:IS66 family insertion sequence element accessory protein TnpB [Kofleriaceae bacterium]
MLVPRAVRVYFATQPVNLRQSFEGLSNEVREVLRHDPLAGHIFVFLNLQSEHRHSTPHDASIGMGNFETISL